jgi:hypothetical protein
MDGRTRIIRLTVIDRATLFNCLTASGCLAARDGLNACNAVAT